MSDVRWEKHRSPCPVDLKNTTLNGLVWHCETCGIWWKPDQPRPDCKGSDEQLDVWIPVEERGSPPFPFKVIAVLTALSSIPFVVYAAWKLMT